jgi:hypothetical protein
MLRRRSCAAAVGVALLLLAACGCGPPKTSLPPVQTVGSLDRLVDEINARAARVTNVRSSGSLKMTYTDEEGHVSGTDAEPLLALEKPSRLRLRVEKFGTRLDLLCDGMRFLLYENLDQDEEEVLAGTLARLSAGQYTRLPLFISPDDFLACLGIYEIDLDVPGQMTAWEVYPHTYKLNVLAVDPPNRPRLLRSFFIDRFYLQVARYQSFAPDGRVELDALLYYPREDSDDPGTFAVERVRIKRPFDRAELDFRFSRMKINEGLPAALFSRSSFRYDAPLIDLDRPSSAGR